jgi:hypothetical protein
MPWNVWNETQQRWMILKSQRYEASTRELLDIYKREFPDDVMEVRKVRPVMEQHGTTLMKLKPRMIWDIAMADLDRRERNKTKAWDFEHYAFHRDHVAGANTANDIIRAAIADRALGLASDKADTRLIYSDLETLKAALA